MKSLMRIFLIVALVATGIALTSPRTASACNYRWDWPVYVVQRGDTLARIAQRYRVSLATLVDANCITNPSRIFTGQQLRVPPGGGPGPIPGEVITGNYNIPATTQLFENGVMIFRADNGTIYAISYNGRIYVFPSWLYGFLPDNPYPGSPPPGRIRPYLGFGKVWGNFAYVRNALGWATASEQGYILNLQTATGGVYYLTLVNGSRIRVNPNGTWTYSNPPPPITPTFTPIPPPGDRIVFAAFQQFQRGFMLWQSDNGKVWVLYTSGAAQTYPASAYSPLPDNPFPGLPPAGYIKPINAFGKVWGNFNSVRDGLGWAVLNEQGYNMRINEGNPALTEIVLPNGARIEVNRVGGWRFLSGSLSFAIQPPIEPTAPEPPPLPTPVPTLPPPPPPETTNETTQAAFQPFENGYLLWLANTQDVWALYGGTSGSARIYALYEYSGLPDNPVTEEAPPGRAKPINAFGRLWGNLPEVRSLGWGLGVEQGYTATITRLGPNLSISTPDGRTITISGSEWRFGG